jgi:hypothetical protein
MTAFRRAVAAAFAIAVASASTRAAAQADGFFVPDWTRRIETPTSHLLLPGVPTAAPYSYYYRYPAPYPYVYAREGCLVDAAVFDDWGIFRGHQRLRVAC